MNTSDFCVERLKAWGVKRIFGYSGDGINGAIGAIQRDGTLDFIQVRHEEMAAFMATAHAKFTGELGVCLATGGPGATHLLTGLYDAKLDHMPVLAICGQAETNVRGASYQQELNLDRIFQDVAEYVQEVDTPAQLPHVIDRAIRLAIARRGPSVVTAGYIDSIGEPTADLRSNIAAEARAKIVYERLINLTADAGVREALGFLMTREIAHQQSFEKALYAIQPNFPPGKLAGMPEFANLYVNTSQGEGDMRGSWNSDENFKYISDRDQQVAMDGNGGLPEVSLSADEKTVVMQMAQRTRSNPSINPETGADLGRSTGGGTRH